MENGQFGFTDIALVVNRALYHTLEILLHRPFVSDGHLRSVSPSAAAAAFNTCVYAAKTIDQILSCYGRRFSMKSAPYILSYATYVSATIHARVAGQSPPDSQAHASLQRCVLTLTEHQESSLGPKKALEVIQTLIRAVRIDISDKHTTASPNVMTTEESTTIPGTHDVNYVSGTHDSTYSADPFNTQTLSHGSTSQTEYDMDSIYRSFNIPSSVHDYPSQDGSDEVQNASMLDTTHVWLSLDPLYGLENIGSFV